MNESIDHERLFELIVDDSDGIDSHKAIPVLVPTVDSDESADRLAREAVGKDLRKRASDSALARGAEYKDLQVRNVEIDCKYFPMLFPAWVGGYRHRGKTHRIHVSGMTGDMKFEVPSSVVLERWLPPLILLLAAGVFWKVSEQVDVDTESQLRTLSGAFAFFGCMWLISSFISGRLSEGLVRIFLLSLPIFVPIIGMVGGGLFFMWSGLDKRLDGPAWLGYSCMIGGLISLIYLGRWFAVLIEKRLMALGFFSRR